MSDLLTIGSSAVEAYQRALATTSNNIANLNTEGYTRQEVTLSASAPENRGYIFLGTGVVVNGVRRAFSEFATANLRNSYSTLNTQGPLVEYANRVIDVMGNAQSGLSPALDQFFSSARSLSAEPASSDLRGQFLSSADNAGSRFRELAGELGSVEAETRDAIGADLEKINTLTAQLASINGQLRRTSDAARQPPALLDQRDKLLGDLSKIAGISVQTKTSGEVNVCLGNVGNQGVIVDGSSAHTVGVVFNDNSAGKVDIMLDPSGDATSVSNLDSGNLAGLIAFRQQVLEPAQSKLDTLAQVFAGEINKIQTAGIDAGGTTGKPLYAISPVFRVEAPASHSGVKVGIEVLDTTATAYHDIVLRYDETKRVWSATDAISRQTVKSASGANELSINGARFTLSGAPQNAETITLRALQRPASSIHLVLTEAQQVAAGALFRAISNPGNNSAAAAMVAWQTTPAQNRGPHQLDMVLVNNPHPSSGIAFANPANSPMSAIACIPAGFRNIQLQLQSTPDNSLDLQVLTRDGRQLLGTPLGVGQQISLLSPANGFVAGASYSSEYLNQSGDKAYRDLDLFYGARAVPGGDPVFDAANNLTDTRTLLAQIEGSAIPAALGAPGGTYIAAGALTLNGVALGSLVIPAGGLQAGDVATWINSQVAGSDVRVQALNHIRIGPADLGLRQADAALSINATDIFGDPGSGFADADSLATAINAQSSSSGVQANIGLDGVLTLTNTAGNEGRDIAIGTPPGGYRNALNISAATMHGQISISSSAELRLGVGPNGSAADLARIGLRAGVFVNGAAAEDLLVFASGTGTGSLAGGYEKGSLNSLQSQRAAPLNITFTTANTYTITDLNTGSVLAMRAYDPQAGIEYGNLKLELSSAPATGDQFLIDSNRDGTASNENMLRIIDLEKNRDVLAGGKTIGEAYNDLVSGVGNVSSQAQIAQQALTVVNQQAIETRDKASGVNLDSEAADLIRFQQAYQAAAKTIQIASQLFDSIIQIR